MKGCSLLLICMYTVSSLHLEGIFFLLLHHGKCQRLNIKYHVAAVAEFYTYTTKRYKYYVHKESGLSIIKIINI